jgi:hypothetical protein
MAARSGPLLVDEFHRPLMGEKDVDDSVSGGGITRPYSEEDSSRGEPVAEIVRERAGGLRGIEYALSDARPTGEDGISGPGAGVDSDDQLAVGLSHLERMLDSRAKSTPVSVFNDDKHVGMGDLAGLVGRSEHDRNPVGDSLTGEQAHRRQPALSQESR